LTAACDHVIGDATGLAIPAHPAALLADGAEFLTRAFRAFGAMSADNRVIAITDVEHCPGGSTGAKLFLRARYARPEPGLPEELFVKFSRDFTDARRDLQRGEMEGEARFAAISRLPGFPIEAPAACFADFHHASGTGLIVTEQVKFGEGAIEPHRRKCLDHLHTPQPLPYYRAIVTALARLAGAHKAGRLAPDVADRFPWDPVAGTADRMRGDAEWLSAKLDHCRAFAAQAPQLLPPELRSDEFHARMRRDALRILALEAPIQRYLTGNPDLIALCHWNAHIDNCWFHRDEAGALHCGLIDWGRVGQLTFGSVFWGGISAAHHDIWDHHLDELLALFAHEYHRNGGPAISVAELTQHVTLHIALMGVARMLDFPEIVLFRLPAAVNASGPRDPLFQTSDPARNCLHVYTAFLKFWHQRDFSAALDRLEERI
jgi:hypothetical protein